MCNGIAVLVWEENGRLKGLCNGEKHHDILCKENENLRLGKIEPYRFELLYPANLVYDRGAKSLPLANGLFGEQPPREVWDVALSVAQPYFMKHTKEQLEYANLRGANLRLANLMDANLRLANLMDANLRGANLKGANLMDANLRGANLRGANLRGANLLDANLLDANLRLANLRGANLRGANLRLANLMDANLRLANLEDANLRLANLRGANLGGANLVDAFTNRYTILPDGSRGGDD